MAYTPETLAIIAAVVEGKICPECGAPWTQRHFDECSHHPVNRPKRCPECRNGNYHNHIHTMYCGSCSYFVQFDVDDFDSPDDLMDAHRAAEHPREHAEVEYIRAMSRDG